MKKLTSTILAFTLLWACDPAPEPGVYSSDELKDDVAEEEDVALEPEHNAPENLTKDGITLRPFKGYLKYPEARLMLNQPRSKQVIEQKKVNFDFTVSNFELGVATADADHHPLANSDKGQHIHLIVDNDPYSAHYEPKFSKEFEPGVHYAIAFLSRSYHLSVKNNNAYRVFQFTVEETAGDDPKLFPIDEPMLFYSRPKGTYNGEAAKNILFDFYLHEAELEPDGYSVLATINHKTTFEIDEWTPFILEGLPMGENTISIELVDAQGRPVNAEVNQISRTFTLKAE